jgi:hypothetical protein
MGTLKIGAYRESTADWGYMNIVQHSTDSRSSGLWSHSNSQTSAILSADYLFIVQCTSMSLSSSAGVQEIMEIMEISFLFS